MSRTVTQLPPTIGIADPETRQAVDAIINHLDLRAGNTNINSTDRYITVRDLQGAVDRRNSFSPDALTSGGVAGIGGSNGDIVSGTLDNMYNQLQQDLITQILQESVPLVDTSALETRINDTLQFAQTGISSVNQTLTSTTQSLTTQLNAAVSRIGAAEAAIVAEATTRATADTATTNSLNAAISRIGTAEGAITTEQTTRTNRDNALAQAINTIWAAVGGASAVIQDGTLAAVSPAAVSATKFTQVQAALADPYSPGSYISSAAIRADATAAINAANQVSASYTVKIDVNGYVTGFGLAVSGNTSSPTSSFQVRADRFSIVSPSGNTSALIMTSNTIRVFDEFGRLRVKIGNLAA